MLVSSTKKRDIHQFKRDRPQKNGTVPAKTGRMVTLFKNGIHRFRAWRSANRDSVENKLASLLVVSLGKTLNAIPPS